MHFSSAGLILRKVKKEQKIKFCWMSQPFDNCLISPGWFVLLWARTSVYSSRRSGRNNKRRFLLSAVLRVSPPADERTLKILSEWKKVWKEYTVLALIKGKQRLQWEEKESFSVYAVYNASIFDHIFTKKPLKFLTFPRLWFYCLFPSATDLNEYEYYEYTWHALRVRGRAHAERQLRSVPSNGRSAGINEDPTDYFK